MLLKTCLWIAFLIAAVSGAAMEMYGLYLLVGYNYYILGSSVSAFAKPVMALAKIRVGVILLSVSTMLFALLTPIHDLFTEVPVDCSRQKTELDSAQLDYNEAAKARVGAVNSLSSRVTNAANIVVEEARQLLEARRDSFVQCQESAGVRSRLPSLAKILVILSVELVTVFIGVTLSKRSKEEEEEEDSESYKLWAILAPYASQKLRKLPQLELCANILSLSNPRVARLLDWAVEKRLAVKEGVFYLVPERKV